MIAPAPSVVESRFAANVDGWTRAAIVDGLTDFSALLKRLPSVYPTELFASLDRLAGCGQIASDIPALVRQQAGASPNEADGRSLLPVPHPLDFEWRFTTDASRMLLDSASDLTCPPGDLLLFGTPGVALEALALPVNCRVTFVAEDNCVTARVIALNQAIGSPIDVNLCDVGVPRASADVVVLDPPWYADYIRGMLTAAASACRTKGAVLVSLPPAGTRPSADADCRATIAFAQRLGLKLEEHRPLAIGYETPFFERNALAVDCIHPPPHWRRGDLYIFRKVSQMRGVIAGPRRHSRPWAEVGIGRMRLFIHRGDQNLEGRPELRSLVDGDILPTISRRDPRRRLARVWTSGNRIFSTNRPELVFEAALSCNEGPRTLGVQRCVRDSKVDRLAIERIAKMLADLAATEEREEFGACGMGTERSKTWKFNSRKC